MPLTQCPVCHQKPDYAGNTAYCPYCGWNREVAIASLQASLKFLPAGIAMLVGFAAFLYWGLKFNRTPMVMIFPCVPALVVPLNFLLVKKKLAKLKSMPARPLGQAPSQPATVHSNFNPVFNSSFNAMPGSARDGTQIFPATSRDEALLRTTAPRQIRMAKRGKIAMSVAAFGLAVFVVPMAVSLYNQWNLYHSFANVQGLGWMIAIEAIVALAAFGIWRTQVRESSLLKNGEVAMGRVVSQLTDQKNNSTIQYEFKDSLGSPQRGGAQDLTSQLVSGSSVAVFYDRDNPTRSIPSCATYHEVVLPFEALQRSEGMLAKQ